MPRQKKLKKILVVEDELPLLMAINRKLTQEGFEVVEAINGVECLSVGKKEKPDLILLDIIMPKMDGLTALKKLRKTSWGKKMPVIILTNLSEAESISEAIKSEAYDYLIKTNWSLQDVVKKVKEKVG